MHRGETRLNPRGTKRSILKRLQLLGLDVRGVVCRERINRIVFDSGDDGVEMFLRAERRIHFGVRVVPDAFFVGKREMLYGGIRSDVFCTAFLCFPNRSDAASG